MVRNIAGKCAITLIAAATILNFQKAIAHGEEEGPVALEPDQIKADAGSVSYTFQLVDTKNNKLLTDADLDIVHEKKLHFFAYDPSLSEFRHLHPEYTGGKWQVTLDLAVNGQYWMWAQGQTSAGVEFTASNRLTIEKGAPTLPPAKLNDIRKNADGISSVTFEKKKVFAKRMTMLNFEISRTDGTTPQVTDYLGAKAHFVVVPDDGDSLIHVHPMAGSGPNDGMIHVTFPAAGTYRVWMQFVDAGTLRTIPLSIKVL